MKINSIYKIVVEVGDRILTYMATILKEDEFFITFKDKNGSVFSYNKNKIVSAEEMES